MEWKSLVGSDHCYFFGRRATVGVLTIAIKNYVKLIESLLCILHD